MASDTHPRCGECNTQTSLAAVVIQSIAIRNDDGGVHHIPSAARCKEHATMFRRSVADLPTIKLTETRVTGGSPAECST